MRYHFWRGNDGRNKPGYTKVEWGVRGPRSLTLETTTAFVLHSRARHLLAHGRLCCRCTRLLQPLHISFLSLPHLTLDILCPLFFISPLSAACRFRVSVSPFLFVSLPIPMWPFPSLSRTHLIYRAVRYDQQQFSSVRWRARC